MTANGRRGSRVPAILLAALLAALPAALLGTATPAAASHDPSRTVTVYVHGFDHSGADRHGIFGADVAEPLADSLAVLAGLSFADTSGGPIAPDAVTATTYYGDTPPRYYTAEDRAEIDRLTAQWGGGVPRYAYIVARFAQQALVRSGADQVNFVSGSFGSLVVRWLIEKNVAGLAGSGRIARWLSIEGLIAGNWAASRTDLRTLLDLLQPEPIDVDQMEYGWVDANLHSPRTEGDSPYYAGILVGQEASSDDSGYQGDLTTALLAFGDWMPNDGVQAVPDAQFRTFTAPSRLAGLPPTLSVMHSTHLGIGEQPAAYAQAITFITGRHRVTATLTSARVTNLREPQLPYWDWRPAEVLFESEVHSPALATRWGIDAPLSLHSREDGTAPLHRYSTTGETQALSDVVFDDFVLPDETRLRIALHADEVDYDPRYGVFETITTPYVDDMGGTTVEVSTLGPGTYAVAGTDWSGTLAVSVHDYPFQPFTPLAAPPLASARAGMRIAPNPSWASTRISLAGALAGEPDAPARLEIADVSGRLVRVLEGRAGDAFVWDGRDAAGRPLPPGVYLHRIVTPAGVFTGRSCRVSDR